MTLKGRSIVIQFLKVHHFLIHVFISFLVQRELPPANQRDFGKQALFQKFFQEHSAGSPAGAQNKDGFILHPEVFPKLRQGFCLGHAAEITLTGAGLGTFQGRPCSPNKAGLSVLEEGTVLLRSLGPGKCRVTGRAGRPGRSSAPEPTHISEGAGTGAAPRCHKLPVPGRPVSPTVSPPSSNHRGRGAQLGPPSGGVT